MSNVKRQELTMNAESFNLRPGVSNMNQWLGSGRKNAVSAKLRKVVLARDDNCCMSCSHRALKWMHIHHIEDEENDDPNNLATLCAACHAVMHFGRSMKFGTLEIWKSTISQVEVVRTTRKGVQQGMTLQEIKESFGLKRGRLAPDSFKWANGLLQKMEEEPRAELPEPLCAIFVDFTRWQIDA